MKLSFIFPPQWDPRQPHLAIPSLIGALNSENIKADIKVWDLNLALYAELICTHKEHLLKLHEYLDPTSLAEPLKYRKLEREIENIILNGYDIGNDKDYLLLDMYKSKLSPNRAIDWQTALKKPEQLPLIKHLKVSISEIERWKPDIIAISTCSDTQIVNSMAIASVLKRNIPKVKIVIGGSPFIERKDFISKADFIFDVFSSVCFGEGEPTLIAIAQGHKITHIPNIIWRDDENILHINRTQQFIYPKQFIADFSYLPIESYLSPLPVIPVETSRGCYWGKCIFCNHPTIEKTKSIYMSRPIEQIINELKVHNRNGVSHFFIIDEAIPASRIRKISQSIISAKLNIDWIAYSRLEKNLDKNTFTIAKLAGLRKVFFGLETGSNKLLRMVNKGTNSTISKRVISGASEKAIAVHLFLIGGFPTETESAFESTLDLLKSISNKVDPFGFTYNFFPLTCGYGTKAYFSISNIGAEKLIASDYDDMATRYLFFPSYAFDRRKFLERKSTIHNLLKTNIGEESVLMDCNFTNDSTHLLAISLKQQPNKANAADAKSRAAD